jgi:lipoyl(octanoyl) transferase
LNRNEKNGWVVELGLIPYGPACELQRELVEARKAAAIPDVLLLCEHPHVVTLGRNANIEHLRASRRVLEQMHVELHTSDRGGDITYHGPGQIVAYPILELNGHRRDVRGYVEQLEDVMIRTTADFGIRAKRIQGQHGAWVDGPAGEEKIGALGVHLSRWVTSHGLAYNACVDLRYFDLIVPCGIEGKGVTSLERSLGHTLKMSEVREQLLCHFSVVFNHNLQPISRAELAGHLDSMRVTASRAPESKA